MAKIFNDKIINSLRKSSKCDDDIDSLAYDQGDTYIIQQVDSRNRKKPIFRRKNGGQCPDPSSGENLPDTYYYPPKPCKAFVSAPPVVTSPCPRAHRSSLQCCSDGRNMKHSDTESDRHLDSPCERKRSVESIPCDEPAPTWNDDVDFLAEIDDPVPLRSGIGRCSSEIPGICYDGLCDPPGHLDQKNVSFFRSILGPYPDEPFLAMIDKLLSFIGFGGGLCEKDMARLALLDDVVEYMPDFD